MIKCSPPDTLKLQIIFYNISKESQNVQARIQLGCICLHLYTDLKNPGLKDEDERKVLCKSNYFNVKITPVAA